MRFIVSLLVLNLFLLFSFTAFSTESQRTKTLEPSILSKAAPSARSLTTTETTSGLVVSTFQTPQGTLRMYLPADAMPGDIISGLITAQPAGSTKAEKESNLNDLAADTLVADGKSLLVIDGKAKWQIPDNIASFSIALINKKGEQVATTELPLQKSNSGGMTAFQLAGVAQAGRPVIISGPFDGDFDNTRIELNGELINVIAESPRRIVVAAPSNASGLVVLNLSEKAQAVHCSYQAVSISLSAPKTSLASGEETTLTIAINGLSKISTKFALELTNESPGVVTMEGGSVQNIDITPDKIPADGIYKTTRALVGLGDGSFQLAARLLDQSAVMSCETASVLSGSPR